MRCCVVLGWTRGELVFGTLRYLLDGVWYDVLAASIDVDIREVMYCIALHGYLHVRPDPVSLKEGEQWLARIDKSFTTTILLC